MIGGGVEIALAVFFYQPYPTHYVGTVPYCLGLGLIFGGWNMILLSTRVRRLASNPAVASDDASADAANSAASAVASGRLNAVEWDGPPSAHEDPLTLHLRTPLRL